MATRPTSRFESIFRAELKSGKGIMSSLGSAGSESQKEKLDLRNMLPKSGILGAILENKFGKSYKYSGSKGPSIESKSAAVQAVSSRMMAKNSMFLPIIAKDMNVMRQNIQMLVKKQGLKPKTQENYGKSISSESTTSVSSSTGGSAAKPGMFSGITDSLGSIGGGVLGLGGAIISGLLGSIGSIGGTFLSGLTSMTGFGLPGIIALIAGGYVVYSLAKSINFSKIGTDLFKVFGDSFDGISKSLKSFFNIKEDEGFLEGFARQLDEAFNTSFFTKNLNDASKALSESSNFIANKIDSAFNTIMAHGVAAAKTLGDVMIAVGKDIIGYTRKWMDSQRDNIYMLIGAAIGGVLGSVVPGVGSVVGAIIGAGLGKTYGVAERYMEKGEAEKYKKNFNGTEGAIKQLDAQIAGSSSLLQTGKNPELSDDTILNLKDPAMRKWLIGYVGTREGKSPEEVEKLIAKGEYNGITLGKIRDLQKRDETALRLLDPQREVSNLSRLDVTKTYAENVAASMPFGSSLSPSRTSNEGGKGDGSSFAKFPSAESGFKAQRALWESSGYSKLSIEEAIKRWSPTATANYGKGIENAIGVPIATTKFSDLSESQKNALLNEQARQEGFFKSGTLPNRLNNPGALKFAQWETKYGAENSGVGEYGKKTQIAANTQKSEMAPPPKNQTELTKYEKMSDTELILSMFGDMFGDLSTSLFKLAETSAKSSQKSGNAGEKISSAEATNFDLIVSEMGLHRVMRGSN
jgi:hypothetical protein